MAAHHRPRILFLDAYDSFSNNITSLLTTLLDADVSVITIDDPLLPDTNSTTTTQDHHTSNGNVTPEEAREARFLAELRRHDALVCGPGPGNPHNPPDVGFMNTVWRLAEADQLPVLGVCLGFQSLVAAHGGKVVRLTRGLHGMVRGVEHCGRDLFDGVEEFRATLYHSLCADVGQAAVEEGVWREGAKWESVKGLVPLAWVEEERGEGLRERILTAVRHEEKPFWGVQYHPESVCTEEEGNKVIVNWFKEATRWNEKVGRVRVDDGQGLARAARKPSLLSRLGAAGLNGHAEERKPWWEVLGTDAELRTLTVPLPAGVQVPEIADAVVSERAERIILDSANAAPATSRADVRGRYSIIAVGLDEAVRIEHHVGDAYATVKIGALGGSGVKASDSVPLAQYGGVWGLMAAFHEARRLPAAESEHTPFVGGFMGYMTYEQGLDDIDVPLEQPRPHHRPDVALAWVTQSIVVDHLQQVVHIQHLAPASESLDKADADDWVAETADKLLSLRATLHQRKPSLNGPDAMGPQSLPTKVRRASMTASIRPPQKKEYEDKVRVCQEYIAAGETYELCLTDQTTLTRPLSDHPLANTTADAAPAVHCPAARKQQQQQQQQQQKCLCASCPPLSPRAAATAAPSTSWALFKRLRKSQPAPFASYLRLGGATLVSASPERFLCYDRAGRCSMRPMKGTVRKSEAVATVADAERILHVPKEEAENLMIVDLVRHDLHGVCGAGNVTVPDLLRVEEYQSVFQMITVVEGQLPTPAEGHTTTYTGLDVLAASLPPGSMTGAPKKRSCEILREIEGHKERGLYSGVVGYMCATGQGDWSVTIRSLFRWDDEQVVVGGSGGVPETHEVWRIGAGGAVTILSTPEGEMEEMFTKLAGPLRIFGEEPCRW